MLQNEIGPSANTPSVSDLKGSTETGGKPSKPEDLPGTTERTLRVRSPGPSAYRKGTLRVFPQDLPCTPYKEAREARVLEKPGELHESIATEKAELYFSF